jgi:hypothetical protein
LWQTDGLVGFTSIRELLKLGAKSDIQVEEGGYSDENFEVRYSLLSEDEMAATTSMTVSLRGFWTFDCFDRRALSESRRTGNGHPRR